MRHVLLMAMLTIAFLTFRADAHVTLDHAEPKVGSKVAASPAIVKIWFSDDVDLGGTTVEVFDASGKRVDKADMHATPNNHSIVIISLPPQLPAGKYKVVWHALCLDRHKTKGDFQFEVSKD